VGSDSWQRGRREDLFQRCFLEKQIKKPSHRALGAMCDNVCSEALYTLQYAIQRGCGGLERDESKARAVSA
jgi:hypothetical protein